MSHRRVPVIASECTALLLQSLPVKRALHLQANRAPSDLPLSHIRHLHGRLVATLHAATQSPAVAEAASQLWRLHLCGESFAAMPCRAVSTSALMQLLPPPLQLTRATDGVVLRMCLVQRVLVHAMGKNLREEFSIGGGGSHLAGVGMVQRADVRGQRGGRRRMGRKNAGPYS